MRKLNLNKLKKGTSTISKRYSNFLFEAVKYCLEENEHKSGVIIEVSGDFEESFKLVWTSKKDKSVAFTWRDINEATEYGATGLAILLLRKLTKFSRFNRAVQIEGIDYWLESEENVLNTVPFEFPEAVLEISGIWNESSSNSISMRVSTKKKHLKSLSLDIPILLIVIGFKKPKSKFIQI